MPSKPNSKLQPPQTDLVSSQGTLTNKGLEAIRVLREAPEVEVLRLWLESQAVLLALPQAWTPDSWLVHSSQHEAKKGVIHMIRMLLDPAYPLISKEEMEARQAEDLQAE